MPLRSTRSQPDHDALKVAGVPKADRTARVDAVAASVGLTEFDPSNPQTVHVLMDAADSLMYAEKRAKHAAQQAPREPVQA